MENKRKWTGNMSGLQKELADWMYEKLWNESGFFAPERLAPPHAIYSTAVDCVLHVILIDGYKPAEPNWSTRQSETPSRALFRHLEAFESRNPASWFHITNQDDADSAIHFVWPTWNAETKMGQPWEWCLGELQATPADQWGTSYTGLIFHDRRAMLVFKYVPSEGFSIAFYGDDSQFRLLREELDSP